MSMNVRRAKGFTLVEILIVVVILGILAAIVVPQFTSASESAKSSSTTAQLQSIRSQLELYQVQHNGNYPITSSLLDFALMTTTTDAAGATSGSDFGPYLQQTPLNPFTGQSGVVAGTTHATGAPATDGWVWDNAAQQVFAVGFDEATNTYTAPVAP